MQKKPTRFQESSICWNISKHWQKKQLTAVSTVRLWTSSAVNDGRGLENTTFEPGAVFRKTASEGGTVGRHTTHTHTHTHNTHTHTYKYHSVPTWITYLAYIFSRGYTSAPDRFLPDFAAKEPAKYVPVGAGPGPVSAGEIVVGHVCQLCSSL